MKNIEDIKTEIILYQLQHLECKGIEYFNFIQSLPRDKEILDFIVDLCPVFWCFLYAQTKDFYSLKLEDKICQKQPSLITRWAQRYKGTDKLRKAVNQSRDPSLILEYAKTIDECFIQETFSVLEELARENKNPDCVRYFKLYRDYFAH